MIWVGIMMKYQPEYIKDLDDPDQAMHNAFYSCGIFLFTFIASIIGLIYDNKRQREAEEEGRLLASMLRSNNQRLTGISDYDVRLGDPNEGYGFT